MGTSEDGDGDRDRDGDGDGDANVKADPIVGFKNEIDIGNDEAFHRFAWSW